jgi:A/G-specific adenine glycosylase
VKEDLAKQFQQDLLEWSEGNLRSFPWREDDATPYEVLIAEIMLKQTRSPTVREIYVEFIKEYPTLEHLAEADREELIEIIQPLGLYNYRADAFMEIAERAADGGLPEDEDELSDLPQVGPYVLNATLCFGFDEERPIMDTNVERIYGRVFKGDGVDKFDETKLWALAEEMLPEGRARPYNLALLDFGYSVCTHSSPLCGECFASGYCDYFQNQKETDDNPS